MDCKFLLCVFLKIKIVKQRDKIFYKNCEREKSDWRDY